MPKLNENVQNVKEGWQKMPEKNRKIIKGIVAATAVIIVIAILVLFFGRDTSTSVLFTGLSQDEATEIAGLLQDENITYKYNASDGTIRVPTSVVETTKANLLARGYPKSGFAYDMYLDNTGLLTTESDKKQITLYELQDRLGATIRAFEGVQDARVTIAEAEEQRYVLQAESAESASASVIITMKSGSALTEEKAQAVKNLVAHAVRGMSFSEVTVYDAGTMLEVGASSGTASSTSDVTELESLIESKIAANIKVVLEKLYGTGNVAVSVKGTLDMAKLISESTEYSTPEKIDETDKTGLLHTEDLVNEDSLAAGYGAGGVVGADANADTPRYTTEDDGDDVQERYSSGSASREWLYNVVKEQRQVDPGVLEDTSVAIVILTNDTQTVSQQDLVRLVANASGISVDVAGDKITIIRAPKEDSGENPIGNVSGWEIITTFIPLPLLIALCAAILLLLLLLLFLLGKRKKKKKATEPNEEDFIGGDKLSASDLGIGQDIIMGGGFEEDDELNQSEEIMNLRMQRSMRLKQNIGEFVEQNPQIAAKLVQSWLRGEGGGDGSSRRKQPK